MEGAIKLNIGNKMDYPMAVGKSTNKGKEESEEKIFGEMMLSLMPESSGKARMKPALKNEVDEKPEKECLPESLNILMIAKAIAEINPDEIVAGQNNIFDMKPEELIRPQLVKSEKENAGQVKELVLPMLFREVSGEMQGLEGKSLLQENEVVPKLDIEANFEIRGLETKLAQMQEADMVEKSMEMEVKNSKAPNQDSFDKLIQLDPKMVKTMNSEMTEKSAKLLDYSEAAKPEKESLHSAKEQSVLNRLTEIGMRVGGELDTPKELKAESLPVDELEKNSKQEQAGEKSEALAKAFGETMGIEAGNSKMEIAKAELPSLGRAAENLDEVADKINLAMDKIRDDGKSVMRIRLKPDELGSIEIRLSQENGIVKGRIIVENEAIKDQLSKFLLDDKLSFMQNGLKPREIEVSLFNQQMGSFENFDQGEFAFQRESGNGGFSEFLGENGDIQNQTIEENKAVLSGLDMFA